MSKPSTLRTRREFRRVLSSGRKLREPAGTFFTLVDPGSDAPARLGLAVPATAGGAVARNRIKRRLRAAFAAAAPGPGIDVVVRAEPEAESTAFQELEAAMQRATAS